MRMPGFTAEASLYEASRWYGAAGSFGQSEGTAQPAFPFRRASCWAICAGNPDPDACVYCCECIRRGGHPWQCCF